MKKNSVNCLICNKNEFVYESRAIKYKTCSRKCMGMLNQASKNLSCCICLGAIHVKPYRLKRLIDKTHITCSKKCSNKLKETLFLGRNNPNTKYMIDDNFFKTIDTAEKAYILGWIASDGTIHENGTITIQVHESDEDCMKLLSTILSDDIDIKNHSEICQVSLRFHSKTMVTDICNVLNISPGKKSDKINFPKLEKELGWLFLRGYFDGDGSIKKIDETHTTPECKITSSSLNMINSISEFSEIPNTLSKDNTNIYWHGNNCLDFLGKLYNGQLHLKLERKYNQYLEISTWVPSVSYSRYWKNEHFNWSKTRKDAIAPSKSRVSDSGYDLVLLEKIKTIGKVELYDTGIKVKPAFGIYFDLVPRSSIIKSGYILANSTGIIDRTYLGNVMVALIKIDENAPALELPNRLVQLIPRSIIHAEFIEVSEEELSNSSRGTGGFGSTGPLKN